MKPTHPHRRRAKVSVMMLVASVLMLLAGAHLTRFTHGSHAAASTDGIAGFNPYTWGVIGSSGIPDDGSHGKVNFSGPFALPRGNTTITLRYNVNSEALDTTLADGFTMWIRMRDNGSSARVRVWLKACSILTGESTTIAAYDSDDLPASPSFELDSIDVCGFTWDFYNYVYYIDARLERKASGGKPALNAIQISELYCE